MEGKHRVSEETRTSLTNEIEDIRMRYNEVDAERNEIRRELQEALRQVKLLSAECLQGKRDVTDLKERLAQEEVRREETRFEAYSIKQSIMQLDAEREQNRQDLAKAQRK